MKRAEIYQTFDDVGNGYLKLCRGLEADFPAWDPLTDARLTVFSKAAYVMRCTKLGFIFSVEYLSNREWWRAHWDVSPDLDVVRNLALDFGNYQKGALILILLAVVESIFRPIPPRSRSSGLFRRDWTVPEHLPGPLWAFSS